MRATPLYTGLRVRQLVRSERFYRALGFRPVLRRRTSLGEFVQLEHPRHGYVIELNRFRRGGPAWEPYRAGTQLDHFGFWVDDVDRWVDRLVRAGGTVRFAPFPATLLLPRRKDLRGRAAFVADPDGIWIELMGPDPARRPRPRRPRAVRRTG